MPLSVSRPALLRRGSDAEFRNLINGLMTISVRMELIRNHLAERLGVTGPQYSLLMAIGHMEGPEGISVGKAAHSLHVTSAFVASESNRLVREGWLEKAPDTADRRLMLLRLTLRGSKRLAELGPLIQAVNDGVFGSLSGADFSMLAELVDGIVRDSGSTLHRLSAPKHEGTRTDDKNF